jgi:hypothetical protein
MKCVDANTGLHIEKKLPEGGIITESEIRRKFFRLEDEPLLQKVHCKHDEQVGSSYPEPMDLEKYETIYPQSDQNLNLNLIEFIQSGKHRSKAYRLKAVFKMKTHMQVWVVICAPCNIAEPIVGKLLLPCSPLYEFQPSAIIIQILKSDHQQLDPAFIFRDIQKLNPYRYIQRTKPPDIHHITKCRDVPHRNL